MHAERVDIEWRGGKLWLGKRSKVAANGGTQSQTVNPPRLLGYLSILIPSFGGTLGSRTSLEQAVAR